MAHKKGQGSVKNGRDSNAQHRGIKANAGEFVTTGSVSKRLGVKKFGSEQVVAGNIIIRQRGTKFHPGKNVKRAKDDTLFAMCDGTVFFDGQHRRVNVKPPVAAASESQPVAA